MVKSINSSLTHWALPRFFKRVPSWSKFSESRWDGSGLGTSVLKGPSEWGKYAQLGIPVDSQCNTANITMGIPHYVFFSAPNYGGHAMILARYWNFRVMWAEIRSRHPLSLSCIRLGSHSIHQIQSRLWKLFRCVMLNYGLPKNAVESNQNHDSWLLSDRLKSG